MLILCLEALVIFLTTNIQIYSVPSLRMEIFHRRALRYRDDAPAILDCQKLVNLWGQDFLLSIYLL